MMEPRDIALTLIVASAAFATVIFFRYFL